MMNSFNSNSYNYIPSNVLLPTSSSTSSSPPIINETASYEHKVIHMNNNNAMITPQLAPTNNNNNNNNNNIITAMGFPNYHPHTQQHHKTSTRDNTIYDIITRQTVIQQCSNKFLLLTGYTPLEIIENDYSISSSSSSHSFPPTSLPMNHSFPSSSAFQFSSDYASTTYCMNNNNNNNNNNNIMNHHHHPTLSLHPINQSIITSTLSTVSASSKAYKKRKKMLQNYICTDCGAQRSTEWRRGPFGPKT
ncbi:unnamed protein product [Cunninghamella echinulata]